MTEFEKKLKKRHNKKMKYNPTPEKLSLRLEREKHLRDIEYDMATGYGIEVEGPKLPRKPKKLRFWSRVISTAIVILALLLLTIWLRYRFGIPFEKITLT